MLRRSLALGFIILAGCSSDSSNPSDNNTGTAPDGLVGDIRESVTWEDGTKLAGVVRVVEGVTVTIAPGARIQCNEAAHILLGGTLKVDAKDNPASISCPKWQGVTIAQNGQLDIDGLEISNAAAAYRVTTGAKDSTVKNSKILTSVRPFEVGANSKLTLDHVEASVPAVVGNFDKSYVEVWGTLEAHYLKYEAQSNEGLMAREGGTIIVTDSELTAKAGQDLVSSYDGNEIHVSYTTMTGAHCGPHMQGVNKATFDHITSVGNLYGITVYKGGNIVVKDSNLGGSVAWLDKVGEHGPMSVENVYLEPTAAGTPPNAIYEPNVKTQPLLSDTRADVRFDNAKPR